MPKGSGIAALYTSAIWIGGLDTGNNLHLAANYFRNGCDYFPGPVNAANPSSFDKIWKVNRYKVEEFKYEWSLGNVQSGTYTPDASILTWPAMIDTSYAPFVDINNNGIYDPLTGGDYPKVKGDQCLYWIMNDSGAHTVTGGLPMQVEIHASAYAYTCPQLPDSEQVLNYTTLYHYEVFNKSTNQYDSTFFGYWQDPDLGNYQDDMVGCYPKGNYGYVYNGDSIDDVFASGYGLHPPMLSTIILNGPLADAGDSIDNDNDSIIDEPGEKNLMTNFGYFMNGGNGQGDPGTSIEFYNYLTAHWKDGTPFTYGGGGKSGSTPTHFIFPDFPYDTSGWNQMNSGYPASDLRSHMSCGPFTLLAGAVTDFNFAIVWTRDTALPYLSKAFFDKNYKDNMKIKQWFETDSFPSCLVLPQGINESNQNANSIIISPNPSSDFISVTYKSKTKNPQIEILDVMGRKIAEYKLNETALQINISKLPQGLYLLKVTDGENSFAKRFVKE